ncbi:hypothetical protein Tco_0003968 [Tanacetum coccineum]
MPPSPTATSHQKLKFQEFSHEVVSASVFDNKDEILSSTEVINSGSKEQVKEPVNQNQYSTVSDATVVQQKDNPKNNDDKSSGLICNAILMFLLQKLLR